MIYEKDTVMRIIRQIGEFWQALMQKVDDAEAEALLRRAYLDFCGLDAAAAEQLAPLDLAEMLDGPALLALSELTRARADRFERSLDGDVALALRVRALTLLCAVRDDEIAGYQAARAREWVLEIGSDLPLPTALAALGFLTRGGAYAAAEDLLFAQLALWRKGRVPAELLQAGRFFYDQLMALPEQALIAGGLPREEVAQGRRELFLYE